MRELERELGGLRPAWPETPDVAAAVLRRIEADAGERVRSRSRRWVGKPAAAVAAVLALLGGAMAVAPARSAIVELLGLDGARIERRSPDAPPPARQPPLGAGLGLGERVTAAQARRRAAFRPAPPGDLPAPYAVYFSPRPAGGAVSYVYGPRRGLAAAKETGVGLLVTELLATVAPVIEKAAGSGTTIEPVRIGSDRGFWLGGEPHGFAYLDREGVPVFEDQRLAAPTLLVERGDGILLRIEGRVTKQRALALARSVAASR